SGKFISDNFKQALRLIEEGAAMLAQWRSAAPEPYTDAEIESWRTEELEYLQNVPTEVGIDIRHSAYVEALEQLKAAQAAVLKMRETIDLVVYPVESGQLSVDAQAVARAKEAERNALQRKLLACMGAADDTERLAGITERWKPDDELYRAALQSVHMREFEKVLGRLEGLVVQRLAELSKANLARTCYKLRKHIAANLSKRSEAIRAVLAKYNELAPKQDPPRPRIQYSDIVSYAFIGEFQLLKYSKHDILQRPWSVPSNRQMADKYHKIKRAKEEIIRSRVEARRLRRWIDQEDATYRTAIENVKQTDPLIAAELAWLYLRQARVNNVHRVRLQKLYALPSFGIRYADDGDPVLLISGQPSLTPTESPGSNALTEGGLEGLDEDDSLNDEALRLGEYMSSVEL
ncbi:hypothetical protein HDZ31DRAFT_47382, partial [Schizophyllum fasciatum]